MAMEHTTDRRTRHGIPFAIVLVAAVIALGLAAGFYSLRATPDASTVGAISVPAAPVAPLQACQAMDPTAHGMYCSPARATLIPSPRATWQACAAMDPTAYRMYCGLGDGGRWIDGS